MHGQPLSAPGLSTGGAQGVITILGPWVFFLWKMLFGDSERSYRPQVECLGGKWNQRLETTQRPHELGQLKRIPEPTKH